MESELEDHLVVLRVDRHGMAHAAVAEDLLQRSQPSRQSFTT